jgi:glycosyltransferase involved in cell wall biosynthesis
MAQIRVLQFITPSGFYGAERWILALANNINCEEVICDLAVTSEQPSQDLSVAKQYPAQAGQVFYLPMKSRFDPTVIRQIVRIIRKNKIDLIHTHGYKSDTLGLIAARISGIPCVSTPHGFSGKVDLKLGVFIRIGTFFLRFFDRVCPLSEELLEDMRRCKVPQNRLRFIRNGVDLREIDTYLLQSKTNLVKNKDPLGNKTIGFIGQLIPRKGIKDLLKVFDVLYQTDNRLRLKLLGEGHQRGELEAQAKEQASASAIEFMGFREDRLNLLAGFDLFVMTSSLEGIPRCVMEAMALGVPVVAYNIPGVDQLVKHEETGLLAPYADQDALAACCRRILVDDALAGRLSNAGRALIDREYSAEYMAKTYQRLYQELVQPGMGVSAEAKKEL